MARDPRGPRGDASSNRRPFARSRFARGPVRAQEPSVATAGPAYWKDRGSAEDDEGPFENETTNADPIPHPVLTRATELTSAVPASPARPGSTLPPEALTRRPSHDHPAKSAEELAFDTLEGSLETPAHPSEQVTGSADAAPLPAPGPAAQPTAPAPAAEAPVPLARPKTGASAPALAAARDPASKPGVIDVPESVRPATLRRDESVIAEAMALRKNSFRRTIDRMLGGVDRTREIITDDAPAYLRYTLARTRKASVSGVAHGLADRFSSLTIRQQALLVIAPYALAALLLAIFVFRKPADQTIVIPAASAGIAEQGRVIIEVRDPGPPPASVTMPAQDISVAGAALPPPAPNLAALKAAAPAPAALAPAPDPVPPPAVIPVPPAKEAPAVVGVAAGFSAISYTVPIKTRIYVAPSTRSARAAKIKAGSMVLAYPMFAAPPGWILVRRPNAEIGFMVAANLDGKRDPKLEVAAKPATPPAKATSVAARDRPRPRSSTLLDDERPKPRSFTPGASASPKPPKKLPAPASKKGKKRPSIEDLLK